MTQQPYISKSNFSAPPDSRGPGASYLGEPVPRGWPAGPSAPTGGAPQPPDWWHAENPRCGRTAGGDTDPRVLQTFWHTVSGDDDPVVIQITAEDRIVGRHVERTISPTVRTKPGREAVGAAELRRLISAATAALELVGG